VSLNIGQMSALLPWNFISEFHEGVVVQKDGILQRSFAYRAPDADALNKHEVSELSVRVNDFARRLGLGWTFFIEAQRFQTNEYPKEKIRFTNAFDTLAPYLIEREREEAFTNSSNHFETSYYITFVWKPPVENVKKLTNMFIQSAKGTSKVFKENVDYFVNETDSVVALLSNNMFILPLDNQQTVAYLHSSISFNRHDIYFPECEICLDRILPDSELVNSLTMRLGDYYIPIIGVNDFPDSTYPAIFNELNKARLQYRWVTRYICLSKAEGKNEVQKKEKLHKGSRTTLLQSFAKSTQSSTDTDSGMMNHGAIVKEADAIQAGVEIENDDASVGNYTSNIMVWDEDYETAKKKAEIVRGIVNSAGFTAKEEIWNALESFCSMMPGQVYANYRKMLIMSYNLAHCVPLSSVWEGLRVNVHAGRVSGSDLPHITCSTREGAPFFFNLNPGGDVFHTAIFGPTGAGKSTLLGLCEAQFYRYPDSQVIVFDKGRSCRMLCLACGGMFFEPASENIGGVSFQPLRDLETDRDMQDAMDFVESLFIVNGYLMEPLLRAAIKENLELLKDKPVEQRTITSLVHYANSFLNPQTGKPLFKEALADYLWGGGRYGKIFDSAISGISIDTRFLAFEMEELMNRGDGAVVPALVYLFNLVDKKFDGRKLSLLILDEAWLFLKNETFSDKIAEWLKVLRKRNVGVVFATQDVADVVSSPLKTTIAQQCLTKIYLADSQAFTDTMLPVYRSFGLTDTEIDYISQATMKRDYFYTSHLGRRMFQLNLGPLTLALIGAPKHSVLDTLVAEKGSGVPLCGEILDAARVQYEHLIRDDAPKEEDRITPVSRAAGQTEPRFLPPFPVEPSVPAAFSHPSPLSKVDPAAILEAVAVLSDRRKKGEGRAAEELAEKLNVSATTIYQARNILRYGSDELIEQVRSGKIGIKKASKTLKRKDEDDAHAEAG